MTSAPPAHGPAPRKPLRLWPGVVIAIALLVGRFVLPVVWPEGTGYGVMGGFAAGVGVLLWWLFFSRAPWSERLGALVLMAVALYATRFILDKSIATGAMGALFYILAVPTLALAFVAGAVATRHLPDGPRRAWMAVAILVGCGGWALVRTGGFNTAFDIDFSWRWAETPEERLLAQADEPSPLPSALPSPSPSAPAAVEAPAEAPRARASVEPAPPPPAPAAKGPAAEWPGFRGPKRDGLVRGVRIATDWSASPPVELWRRKVGPGWSSFAVRGDLLYTQEQRGEDEVVACYSLTTGKPVWRHGDKARFWESNGGAGPRGTPTLGNGRVFTVGGTGVVNALDARTGAVVWSHDAASDTGAKTPMWGFASSPLVVDDLVIVAASGSLVAYDAATGNRRWLGPSGGGDSYSSPHLLTAGGVSQVLLLSAAGLTSVAPSDGKLLWQHAWKGYPIVQPALTAEGDVLISVTDGSGIRRLAIARGSGEWTITERWTTKALKPYFNDFVVHNGHAYGFDGRILACIDLQDGQRKWKGGRFGQGQLVLLPDQDLLLVLSEEGELGLVKATPDQFTEVARRPAIEGKTWNHPVLAGDVLLVRNAEEMVAYRLPLDGERQASSSPSSGR
jgi:outer membrane protein assembly factor BamB